MELNMNFQLTEYLALRDGTCGTTIHTYEICWILNFNCLVLVILGENYHARNIEIVCHKTSNISRTLVGSKIVDNSDVVGASPVGAAPTTSSFSS